MGKLIYSTATPCGYFLNEENAKSFRNSLLAHGHHPSIEPLDNITINVRLIRDYYSTNVHPIEKKFDRVYKVTVPLNER
jgi:hypothetical protein